MKHIRIIILGVVVCTLMNFHLFAQEQTMKVGFFAGIDKLSSYTPTKVYFNLNEGSLVSESFFRVGAMIELPKLLIKPDVIVRNASAQFDDKLNDISHTDQEYDLYGGGLSLYYSLPSNMQTHFYVGPRAEFAIAHSEEYYSDGDPQRKEDSSAWSIMACIAGQHFFNRHFSVFAEIGAGYGTVIKETVHWEEVSGDVDTDEIHRYPGIFTYGGQIGVAFYF